MVLSFIGSFIHARNLTLSVLRIAQRRTVRSSVDHEPDRTWEEVVVGQFEIALLAVIELDAIKLPGLPLSGLRQQDGDCWNCNGSFSCGTVTRAAVGY